MEPSVNYSVLHVLPNFQDIAYWYIAYIGGTQHRYLSCYENGEIKEKNSQLYAVSHAYSRAAKRTYPFECRIQRSVTPKKSNVKKNKTIGVYRWSNIFWCPNIHVYVYKLYTSITKRDRTREIIYIGEVNSMWYLIDFVFRQKENLNLL